MGNHHYENIVLYKSLNSLLQYLDEITYFINILSLNSFCGTGFCSSLQT